MAVEVDITELKNKDKKIQRQVELQNILIEVSSTYINIDINHIDGTINSALEKLAHFVDADRAYIFDYNFKEGTTSNTYEWCAPGIEPELDNLQGISLEYLQDWLEKHIKGLPLVVPDVARLPIAENGETNLRSILEPQGIQSLITIPVLELGELLGFLGFDSVRIKRDFAEEEIKLLTLFGQILISVRQKQKAQKQLQIQEEKYRNIIANMNLGFLEVDGEDVIQTANQSFCAMSGFSLNEMVGQKGIEMFFGDNDDSKKSILERNRTRKEGKTDVYEMEILTKTGEIKHWIISGGPNYNDSGEFVGSIGLHLDITDQKKLENEQLLLLSLTQNQNDRLKNFAHIVSHNLRSHAANLSGMTSFMEIQSKEFAENSFFQNFKNVIDNLMDSIHNLSEVSEIQTNDRTVMERVDLIEILNSSLLNVSSLALTSEVSIDFTQKNESIPVLGNSIYLESITLNLLTNAIKYRDSKKSCEIKILIQVKDETVELQVVDNGLGIDLKRQGRKIFGMYKTFHDHPDSRGIGLFITKNQVEALGGEIEVESKEGTGSSFKVTLKRYHEQG
jgi:PAS domain S-box-containing protein